MAHRPSSKAGLSHALAVFALLLTPASAVAQHLVETGSYMGDAVSPRSIEVPFAPRVVITKRYDAAAEYARFEGMPPSLSRFLGGSQGPGNNAILTLDALGFTVGDNTHVNDPGSTHYWMAFSGGAAALSTGTYVGDGSDNRQISSPGFEPDLVIVLADASGTLPKARLSTMADDSAFPFGTGALTTDALQRFVPQGFEVGTHSSVNRAGTTYWFAAWQADGVAAQVGSYVGDGQSGRAILVGWRPEFVLLRAESSEPPVFKLEEISGTGSIVGSTSTLIPDLILSLDDAGFTVGNGIGANAAAVTYHWIALRTTPGIDVPDGGIPNTDGGMGEDGGNSTQDGGPPADGGATSDDAGVAAAPVDPGDYVVGCDCGTATHSGWVMALGLLAAGVFAARRRS